jgi:hypothetical protein
MEHIKVTLCPHCTECPSVEITSEGITIGEDENTVWLSHAEWNELVRLIKQGELELQELHQNTLAKVGINPTKEDDYKLSDAAILAM